MTKKNTEWNMGKTKKWVIRYWKNGWLILPYGGCPEPEVTGLFFLRSFHTKYIHEENLMAFGVVFGKTLIADNIWIINIISWHSNSSWFWQLFKFCEKSKDTFAHYFLYYVEHEDVDFSSYFQGVTYNFS